MNRLQIYAMMSLCVTTNSFSQNTGSCDRFIDHGINNITRLKSAEHAVAYKWGKYCGIDFQSASDSTVKNATVGVFGYGDGAANHNTNQQRTKLSAWCNQNKEFASSESELFEEASLISAPALVSWERCIEMARKDIRIDFSPIGENAGLVHITIDSTHDGDLVYLGTKASGYECEESMVKSDTQQPLSIESQPKIRNSNIHINCSRKAPVATELNGIGSITHDEAWIAVSTSGPALPIGFPQVVSAFTVTPPGAIIAFDSATCPAGWKQFREAAGRTLIGAGNGVSLSPRAPGETGGVEKHLLTKNEMPVHNHGGATGNSSTGSAMSMNSLSGHSPAGRLSGNVPFYQYDHTHSIGSDGNGKAHENMPPFLVKTYCRRAG